MKTGTGVLHLMLRRGTSATFEGVIKIRDKEGYQAGGGAWGPSAGVWE